MHDGGWWSFLRYDEKQDRPEIGWELIRRVAAYGRPYAGGIALMLGIIVVITLLSLIPPLLIRSLIDQVLPQRNYARLNLLALGMIGIPVLTGLLGVGQRYLSARIGEGVIYDLRVALFSHLQRMSMRFFTNTKTGELMSRLNNDIIGAQRAVSGTIVDLLTNIITLVSTLVIMVGLEWRLTILAVAVLPLFLIPARLLGKRLRGVVREQMVLNAEMNAMMDETLNVSGALLVKLFGRAPAEIDRFRNRSSRVRQAGIKQAFLMRWFFLTVSLVQRGRHGDGILGRRPARAERCSFYNRHDYRLYGLSRHALRSAVVAEQRPRGFLHVGRQFRACFRGTRSAGGDPGTPGCDPPGHGAWRGLLQQGLIQLPSRRERARSGGGRAQRSRTLGMGQRCAPATLARERPASGQHAAC